MSSDIPQEKFDGASRDVEPRLENFQSQRAKVNQMADVTFSCCERLMVRLDTAMATAKEAGSSVNYSAAFESVRERLEVLTEEKKRVDDLCEQREERWKLCMHLNQFSSDVQKVTMASLLASFPGCPLTLTLRFRRGEGRAWERGYFIITFPPHISVLVLQSYSYSINPFPSLLPHISVLTPFSHTL